MERLSPVTVAYFFDKAYVSCPDSLR